MHRVYISASTQYANEGVGEYGIEQDRMMELTDRVKYWLETQKGKFVVFRNQPNWKLSQTVTDANNLAVDIFIDNHTNAGPEKETAGDGGAEGTEVFYNHNAISETNAGRRLATALYNHIAPLSPGQDRGVLADNTYNSSLYVIQNTDAPASLVEHIFHSNYTEVADFLQYMDLYAKAEAQAICEFFGEEWVEVSAPYFAEYDLIGYMMSYRDLMEAYAKDHPEMLEWAKWHYENYGKQEISEGKR